MTNEPFTYQLDLRAEKYYRGLDPENLDPRRVDWAMNETITRIKEWSYEADAHGYCCDRTDMIALVVEIRRLQQLLQNLQEALDLAEKKQLMPPRRPSRPVGREWYGQ
jgi:hypothetical protein